MEALTKLLDSYLDLARHLDPLRHPEGAPAETHQRLGRFDAPWLVAQAAALKSIAHAVEDLETVDMLDDEVDRTALLDTIRTDILAIEETTTADWHDPSVAPRHAVDALLALMDEGFDADAEAGLRARVAAIPDFLAAAQSDDRPVPEVLVDDALLLLAELDDLLDEASEYLDDAAVQPALVALAEHRHWVESEATRGGNAGIGEEAAERRLSLLANEPLSVRGSLRVLELRRAGVERSLHAVALSLGSESPLTLVHELRTSGELNFDELMSEWPEAWDRIRAEMMTLGLSVGDGPCAEDPLDADDRWSLPVEAIRAHAEMMQQASFEEETRPLRQILIAPGLTTGWGRTVAALLRSTMVGGSEEQQLMMCFRALVDSVAAEVDLQMQAQMMDRDAATAHIVTVTGLSETDARVIVLEVADRPLEALAAALAHEGWQSWYAEEGGDPVVFITRALTGAGLSVRLARWALGQN